jgi:hypothetical protein
MVDDPSIEDQGGFEFASGMDIFSEPGVLKACGTMSEVNYGTGASPDGLPRFMVDTEDASGLRLYIAAGTKILESTNGSTFELFLTNANGENIGLDLYGGYVAYAAATKIGRAPIGDGASKDDSFITTLDSDTEVHPMVKQAGTLKIGAGRYVASIDEAWAFTARAMKLPDGYRIRTLTEYLTNLFIGSRFGASTGSPVAHDASIFSWRGIVLAAGSALPDVPYPIKLRAMNALLADGRNLYAWPDREGEVFGFDGIGFQQLRKIRPAVVGGINPSVLPGGVTQHLDGTILFGLSTTTLPGVYQMKNGAICQAFVPAGHTPGAAAGYSIAFVKSTNSAVYIGYQKASDITYHIAKSTGIKQNGAMIRTLWHKLNTDRMKRFKGVRLNLKPLATGTSVAVHYRPARDAAFTDSGFTITSANQNRPILFTVQPRTREIQFKLVYTTATTNSPELLSYDVLFDILNSSR